MDQVGSFLVCSSRVTSGARESVEKLEDYYGSRSADISMQNPRQDVSEKGDEEQMTKLQCGENIGGSLRRAFGLSKRGRLISLTNRSRIFQQVRLPSSYTFPTLRLYLSRQRITSIIESIEKIQRIHFCDFSLPPHLVFLISGCHNIAT